MAGVGNLGYVEIPGWMEDALGVDIDLPRIPTNPDEVVELALPPVEQRLRSAAPWIKARGKAAGKVLVEEGKAAVRGVPTPPGPLPDPRWLPRLIDPVLEPFLEGVLEEFEPYVRETAWTAGALVLGAGLVGGYLFASLVQKRRG